MRSVLIAVACVLCIALSGPANAADKKSKKEKASGASAKVKYVKSPDAIPALIDLSKSRQKMVKQLDAESDAYEKVRSAIGKGGIAPGTPMEDVRKKFGEPANVDTANIEGVTKWIYKKPSKDIASKEKAYLIFDKDGKLTGWEEPK